MTRRDELERLRDAVKGAQEWLSVSRFSNAEHARAKEQLAYVIAAFDALISQEGHEQPPRFDEYGAYGENNPPVGAQRLQGRATAHNPDLPASGAKIGRNGQGKG